VMPLRRRPKRRRSAYTRPHAKRPYLTMVLVVLAVFGGLAVYVHHHTAHYAIVLNGKQIVAVASKEDAQAAFRLVQLKYAPNVPDVVTFTEGMPVVESLKTPTVSLDPHAAAEVLDRRAIVQLEGYAIFVNRIPQVILASRDLATEAISLMLDRGMYNKQGIPTFKQRVTIDVLHVSKEKIGTVPAMTPEQAAEELVHPPRPQVYTVKNGDSFWSIANANGLLVADLDKLNPGKSHLLHEGDQIKLPDKPSAVTVVVRQTK